MIEREILDILLSRTDSGERLNELVDQFRRGRDVDQLMVLLGSSNPEVVSIGAWVLGELQFELYGSSTLVSRLRELLDHEHPAVRFHALSALYPALDIGDADDQALLRKLRSDPNEGVRRSAEAAAARLSTT